MLFPSPPLEERGNHLPIVRQMRIRPHGSSNGAPPETHRSTLDPDRGYYGEFPARPAGGSGAGCRNRGPFTVIPATPVAAPFLSTLNYQLLTINFAGPDLQIQRASHPQPRPGHHVRIDLRRGHIRVPEQFL